MTTKACIMSVLIAAIIILVVAISTQATATSSSVQSTTSATGNITMTTATTGNITMTTAPATEQNTTTFLLQRAPTAEGMSTTSAETAESTTTTTTTTTTTAAATTTQQTQPTRVEASATTSSDRNVTRSVEQTERHETLITNEHTTAGHETLITNEHTTAGHETVVTNEHTTAGHEHEPTGSTESHEGHAGNETNGTTEHANEEHSAHGIHLVSIELENVKYPLVFSLVVILAGLSKIGFHHSGFLSSNVPESCILIILGVVVGSILYFSGILDSLEFFSPQEFFLFLLPPIILEAAYSLHERTFFENLGTILLLAVFGTIISFFLLGFSLLGLYKAGAMEEINCTPIQILVFSALIVAVDPVAVLAVFQEVGVNKVLYFMVFGESLLNDGVTVVVYNVMQAYNEMDTITGDQVLMGVLKFLVVCICSVVIGVFVGLLSSFITRYTNSVKVVEPIMIFGFAYLSYILAEMFHFSGIICIIACGLTQAQYAFCNVTNKSRVAIKFFAKVISNTSEIIIFLFLGLKLVQPNHHWVTGFTLWTTFLCVLYRFIIVYIMAFLVNRYDTNRVRKITMEEMFMISYGGLRGAVCFSLVALLDEKQYPMKNMFVTTTLFVIIFTVFIQGGTIKYLVKKMRVSLADTDKEMFLSQELNQRVTDHLMAGIEQVVGLEGNYYLREKFEHIDNRFIRPLLLRDCTKNTEMEELSMYHQKLVMKEHFKNLQLCGVSALPRVQTSIRSLDSSACLKEMTEDGDQEVVQRQERTWSTSSNKDQDVGQVLRDAFINTSHTTDSIKYHDKNMAFSQRHNILAHIRKRYKQNKRLKVLKAHEKHQKNSDLSGTPARSSSPPNKPTSHVFENAAFQLDETSTSGAASKERRTSRVTFQIMAHSDDEGDTTTVPMTTGNRTSGGLHKDRRDANSSKTNLIRVNTGQSEI